MTEHFHVLKCFISLVTGFDLERFKQYAIANGDKIWPFPMKYLTQFMKLADLYFLLRPPETMDITEGGGVDSTGLSNL